MDTTQKIILTGDRPTGPLHLGHYVGSLANRVVLQNSAKQYILIADMQALTDNVENPQKVHDNVLEVALDYLAVGIDPAKSTIFIQSLIPQIAELTIFYLNLVSVNRLQRNPTVKTEIAQKGLGETVSAGFLMYPVHQAADITIVKANTVPVGEDQLPVIEQTNEIVRAFNRIYGCKVLVEAQAVVSHVPRLPGIDGSAKMSKSLGNAISLSASADAVAKQVMQMYTDPQHIHVAGPGRIEGNTVFTYLDIFGTDAERIAQMKEHYQRGGLGDVVVKKYLIEVLNTFLEPIRTRRAAFAQDRAYVKQLLLDGSAATYAVAERTMSEVKEATHLIYT